MEDVGRVPTDLPAAPPLEPTTIPTLDGWIEALMNCKQLAESDVQRLCEKVRTLTVQQHRIDASDLIVVARTASSTSMLACRLS